MRVLLLAALLSLAACASKEEPCSELACIKQEQRQQLYKQCKNHMFKELHEEILAGFYEVGRIADACRTWANQRVR